MGLLFTFLSSKADRRIVLSNGLSRRPEFRAHAAPQSLPRISGRDIQEITINDTVLATKTALASATLTRRATFHVGFALLLLALVLVGFWPSYYGAVVRAGVAPPHSSLLRSTTAADPRFTSG
jgi:hypothetical protein